MSSTTNQGTGETEEPQGLVPPYESKEDRPIQTDPISKSSGTGPPPGDNSTEAVPDDDGDGLTDTDTDPEPVKGVGEHTRTAAEDIADDTAEGHQGPSGRPVGGSEPEDSTNVDPQENVTGGPEHSTGDQGG